MRTANASVEDEYNGLFKITLAALLKQIGMTYDVVLNTSRQPRSDRNALPRLHLFQHMSRLLAKKAGTSTPSLWCSICPNLVTVCNYMKGRNQIFCYAAYNARHGHVMMAMMRKRIFFT